MNTNRQAIRLNKAKKYYTYQFYGEMLNKNISLNDGLKLAALTCFSWLRERLSGSNIPKELMMPEAKDYKKAKNEDLKSFTINDSYIINVETNIDEGIWALRIIENDTGALTKGEVIPGRTIQSDIGFRIVNDKLECGFRTTIRDLNDIDKANCIRFSVVKELATNPNFELRQVTNIYRPNEMVIEDDISLMEFNSAFKSKDNQMPTIIYTYDDHTLADINSIDVPEFSLVKNSLVSLESKINKQSETKEDNPLSKAIAYANRYVGIARPYFLPKKMFDSFKKQYNLKHINVDEVIVLNPNAISFKQYAYSDKTNYQNEVYNYTRDKALDFKDVLFVDEAKIIIDRANEDIRIANEKLLDETIEKLEQIKSKQARQDRIDEYAIQDTSKDDEYQDALEELEKSRKENQILDRELNRLKRELKEKEEYINYFHRKDTRPKYHKDIVDWASQFESLIFDRKAIDCLNNNDAENVDIDIICDALDYLDKAYSKYLFEGLSDDELNEYSSKIYNRPYNVTPSGIPKSARGNCKIKYQFVNDKRKEYELDQHLKIGSHGELLRIYFIIDKDRKKIVIGSLPNHLEY